MTRVTFVALVMTLGLLTVVVELVRRRRLDERYALLWLATTIVVVILAGWPSALNQLAKAVGIYYPPSALFVLASVFFLALLLHFSVVMTRLSRANVRLTQAVALLEERLSGHSDEAG